MAVEIVVGDEILEFPDGMTDEEMATAIKQYKGIDQPTPEPVAEEEWYEDPTMAARMLLDGFTLGWADEAGAAIAASAYKVLNWEDDTPISEVYGSMKGSLREEEEAYRSANPVAATALNVAGGIAIPMGTVKNAVTGGSMALGTGAKTANTVGSVVTGVGGNIATKTAAGGVLGGVTAAGMADGDMGDAATEGAAWGAGISAVLAGVTKGGSVAWNAASKRRIAEDLVKPDGSFTPITLAGANEKSSPVQDLYKDLFGQTIVGGKKFRDSEQAFIDATRVIRDGAKKALTTSKAEADDAVKAVKRANVGSFDEVRFAFEELKEEARKGSQEVLDTIKTRQANIINKAEGNIIRNADRAVDQQVRAFQRNIFTQSLPAGLEADEIGGVFNSTNILSSKAKVDYLWQDKGFSSIHDNSFQFKMEPVAKKLVTSVQKDIGKYYNVNDVNRVTNEVLEDLFATKNAGGRVAGKDIAKIRASLGSLAAEAPDSERGRLQAALYKKLQGVIDNDVIIPELGKRKNADTLIKDFMDDKASYANYTVLRSAVEKAATNPTKAGSFGPSEVLAAIKANNKTMLSRGTSNFQDDAYSLQKVMNERDDVVRKGTERIVGRTQAAAKSDISRQRSKLAAELRDLRAKEKELANKTRLTVMEAEDKARNKQAIARSQEAFDSLDEKVKVLEQKASSGTGKGGSLFKELAATGVLGALAGTLAGVGGLVAGAAGVASGLAGGVALGKLATTQAGQLAFAGQTGVQKTMQGMQPAMSQAADALRRGAAVAAGMNQATSENRKMLNEGPLQ